MNMKIPFVGPSYQMAARSFDGQRALNWYPVLSEKHTSPHAASLRPCPGLRAYAKAGSGPIRGGILSKTGRGFVVSGFDFYEVIGPGQVTRHGSLETATGRVQLAENNGGQIILVDGNADGAGGWIFDTAANIFNPITAPGFPGGARAIAYQDGYFIAAVPGTQQFAISGINDGFTWDSIERANAANNPDNLVTLLTDASNLWLFGTESTQIFHNSGDATFPFEAIDGAVIPTGCAAFDTPKHIDNSVIWLGVDDQGRGIVWQSHGYNAQRISTQAIERRIAESDDFGESYAFVYHQEGHVFYCLQVKNLDTTLVYDAAMREWHERSFHNAALARREPHRGSVHLYFDQKNLIGDRESGMIYYMAPDFYDDDGQFMLRERIAPAIHDEGRMISHATFELDLEVGQGLSAGQGKCPQIMLQYSDDHGYRWSEEIWRDLGQQGDYKTHVIWHRLGRSKNRVYKICVADPVFVQINAAYVNGT